MFTNGLPQTLSKVATGPVNPLEEPYLFYSQALDQRNDYLTPLLEFEKNEAEYMKADKTKFLVPDLLAYLNSYVGRYEKALAYQDRDWEEKPDLQSSKLDEYEPQNALAAIGKLAETQQVAMINEEHVTPQHRAFTKELLPIMWAKGFRYFAAETFSDDVSKMTASSYPNQKTGFYSDDPVFGDMIRTALKLGFKLVPYEDRVSLTCKNPPNKPEFCQNERERGQAQNLYDRTLKIDPKAKVFVHVGRGHNQKLGSDESGMMGWHFKKISGIDFLSIDQMHSERSQPKFETPLYRYAVKKWNITEPTVFQNKSGKYWEGFGQDVVVFHPRTRYENGRAVWLKMGGERKVVTVKGFTLSGTAPFLVQAFVESEGGDAIPMDQYIIADSSVVPVLMLPKGKFRVRALDATGKVVATTYVSG
jgi:tetratricopeptide (TPR) repeat protein